MQTICREITPHHADFSSDLVWICHCELGKKKQKQKKTIVLKCIVVDFAVDYLQILLQISISPIDIDRERPQQICKRYATETDMLRFKNLHVGSVEMC